LEKLGPELRRCQAVLRCACDAVCFGRCSPGKNRKRAGERINGIDRQDRPPRHQEISNHIMPELLDRYNLSDPFNLKPNDF